MLNISYYFYAFWSHIGRLNVYVVVKTPYEGYYVNVGKVAGQEESKVWTLSFTGNGEQKIPLVLLHGMGSGVALWGLNFDELAADRHVHAFDMLGKLCRRSMQNNLML